MFSVEQFERELRSRLTRTPFQPFLIERIDGEQFVVGEPGAMFYLGGSSGVFFHSDGNFDFVDSEGVRRIADLVPAASG